MAGVRGSCLCGAVSFEITGKAGPVGQCHCSKCRKVSGTDGNAVFYTAYDSLRWVSGEDHQRSYYVSGNSGWRTVRCETCGSPLPHPNKDNKIWFVPAGLLDTALGHQGYAGHIFVGSKADWVEITDKAPQFSEGIDSDRIR